MLSDRLKVYLQVALVVVLGVFSFVNLYSSTKAPGRLTLFERVIMAASAPLQAAVTWSIEGVGGVWSDYVNLVHVKKRNDQLRADLDQLRAEVGRLTEVETENRRLRELLNYRIDNPLEGMITARIIAVGGSYSNFKTVRINRGSSDGVRRDMPVVAPGGVVGRVIETAGGWANVLLITDPSSAVDAMVQRTRARGIVKGTGTEDTLKVEYLLRTDEVEVGDTVVTSGVSEVFPNGLRVGEISSVDKGSGSLFQEASVTPGIEFSRIEEVLVVKTQSAIAGEGSER